MTHRSFTYAHAERDYLANAGREHIERERLDAMGRDLIRERLSLRDANLCEARPEHIGLPAEHAPRPGPDGRSVSRAEYEAARVEMRDPWAYPTVAHRSDGAPPGVTGVEPGGGAVRGQPTGAHGTSVMENCPPAEWSVAQGCEPATGPRCEARESSRNVGHIAADPRPMSGGDAGPERFGAPTEHETVPGARPGGGAAAMEPRGDEDGGSQERRRDREARHEAASERGGEQTGRTDGPAVRGGSERKLHVVPVRPAPCVHLPQPRQVLTEPAPAVTHGGGAASPTEPPASPHGAGTWSTVGMHDAEAGSTPAGSTARMGATDDARHMREQNGTAAGVSRETHQAVDHVSPATGAPARQCSAASPDPRSISGSPCRRQHKRVRGPLYSPARRRGRGDR